MIEDVYMTPTAVIRVRYKEGVGILIGTRPSGGLFKEHPYNKEDGYDKMNIEDLREAVKKMFATMGLKLKYSHEVTDE